MSDTSLAAQAVAKGPQTIAPPSFNGMGWLVVINLACMTVATLYGAMVVLKLVGDAIRNRHRTEDRFPNPAGIYRLLGIIFATGITVRCGVEALVLWGWNPQEPVATGMYNTIKRLFDPFAVVCGLSGLTLFICSEPGMIEQLRKDPFPIKMWLGWPMIRRMLWLIALTFAAAIGVVSTR